MGHLLDQGPGTARLEVAGHVSPLRGQVPGTVGDRVGFHEGNSPDLVTRLVGALDAGAVPVLAHPRWPEAMAADALQRAGAGRPWTGEPVGTLLFTSGSTTAPKVVVHTLEAHFAAARASNRRVPFGPDHRWLLSLPLCHVGGLSLLFRTVVGGGTLVLPDPGERLPEALLRTRPSHVSLVATQLRELLERPETRAALAACEVVLLGGGPCPLPLQREAIQSGVSLRLTYGMTEMGSQIATQPGLGGMMPLPGVNVRTDEGGQLWVRGPSLFAGYLEGETVRAPLVDGWFGTGDLGVFLPDSGVTILGRVDNQFISGGENVRPEALEAALAEHGVDAVIVSVPDSRFGARPVAFTPGGTAHREIAEKILPVFALPVAWLPLPDARGLKPRRGELARIAEEQLQRPQ